MRRLFLLVALISGTASLILADYSVHVTYEECSTEIECEQVCEQSESPEGLIQTHCYQECTPVTVCETKSESYTVSDATTPEELEKLIDEFAEDSELELKLEETAGVPLEIDTAQAGAAEIFDDIGQLREELEMVKASAAEAARVSETAGNSATAGDPVRIATGDFSTRSIDIHYAYNNLAVGIIRSYQSGTSGEHSFGAGWSFNYDTRIICGIKPRAAEELAHVRATRDQLQSIHAEAQARQTQGLNDISEVLERSYDIRQEFTDTIDGIEDAINHAPSRLHPLLQSHLAAALNDKARINSFIARAESAQQELFDSYADIETIFSQLEEAEARVAIAENEKRISDANELRNKLVLNATDPSCLYNSGHMALTLIDENGIARRFEIVTEPVFDSARLLPDGSTNYFPDGADTQSILPNAEELSILADGRYRRTQVDGTTLYYSTLGQLESIRDRNSSALNFHYNDGILTRITDGYGRTTVLLNDGKHITGIVDPIGREYQYAYNVDGRLILVVDAEEDAVAYAYDNSLLTSIIKPDGTLRQYDYRAINGTMRVVRTVDEEGYVESFSYNPAGKCTVYTNPSGITERHYYDENNLTLRIEYGDGSYISKSYDDNNNPVSIRNQAGEITQFEYDDRHNKIRSVDPAGYGEQWSYNTFNQVITHIDKSGRTTRSSYDEKGNLVMIEYPDHSSLKIAYDSRGLPIEQSDPIGNKTRFAYDQHGYLSEIIAADEGIQHFSYDSIGNLLAYTDQAGFTTSYSYNNDNRLVSLTDPLGGRETYTYDNRKDLIQKEDKEGNLTCYLYDARHLLTRVENPLGESTHFEYRPDGKLARKVTGDVSTLQYTYDSTGNLAAVEQIESGTGEEYEYDAAGRLRSVVDPNGNRTEYEYDLMGNLISIQNPLGDVRYRSYDSNQNITSATDFAGSTTEYRYDEMDRLIKEIDPNNEYISYGYDLNGNLTSTTDKNGQQRAFLYNSVNQKIGEVDPSGNGRTFNYDRRGNMITLTDEEGNATAYMYDALGRITQITDPLGSAEKFQYSSKNELRLFTDKNGSSYEYEYDALGRITVEYSAYSNPTLFSYDELGNVLSITDPLLNITQFTYDSLSRLTERIDPLGNREQFRYDDTGNLRTFIDQLGRTKEYQYDSLGRLISKTNPLAEEYQYQYDANGNMLAEIDPHGNTHTYNYDKLNRLIEETNRNGDSQGYAYDPAGNLIGKTAFDGSVTEYQYDRLNRRCRTTFADGSGNYFEYNATGLITVAENEEKRLDLSYDGLGRLVAVQDDLLSETIRYQYDPVGNRLQTLLENTNRSTEFSYGTANELLSLTDPDGNITNFSYDPLLRETSRRRPNDVVTETVYDQAGRITAIKNYAEKRGRNKSLSSFAYLYNPAGQRTWQIDEEGLVTSFSYDAAGRIAETQYPYSGGKIEADFGQRLEFGLFPAENSNPDRDNKHGRHDSVSFEIPRVEREKDLTKALKDIAVSGMDIYRRYKDLPSDTPLHWLITPDEESIPFTTRLSLDSETRGHLQAALLSISPFNRRFDDAQYQWTERYSYDARNNLTSTTNGWGKLDYSYDAANRLTRIGERRYLHDENGNLIKEYLGTRDGSLSTDYHYNPENRLSLVENHLADDIPDHMHTETGLRYTYDALGRRSSRASFTLPPGNNRRTPKWNRETTETYLHNGLSFDILAEYHDTDYNVNRGPRSILPAYSTRHRPVAEYITANDQHISSTEIDQTGSGRLRAKKTHYYLQDILGSVVGTTDNHGHQKEEYRYDAWGNQYTDHPRHPHADRFSTHYGYNGKRLDPAVGLINYGFRDYKPDINRWMTIDPIRDGRNWYAYVGNDPINRIDLWGLMEVYASDITGSPVVVNEGRNLKAETEILIQRNSSDGFYNDTLKVNIGNQTIFEVAVQSEADIENPRLTDEFNGGTLPPSKYNSTLLDSSFSYVNAIRLIDDYIIHPDRFTTDKKIADRIAEGKTIGPWAQPYSAGCQILQLSDFDTLIEELQGVGFNNNNSDTVPVEIRADKESN